MGAGSIVVFLFLLVIFVPLEGVVFLKFAGILIEVGNILEVGIVIVAGGSFLVFLEGESGGDVFENLGDFVKEVDGATLDEIGVLAFANLLFKLFDRELLFEIDQIVEELDAKGGDVIEEIGVGAFFLVHDIGKGKEGLIGLDEAGANPFEADLAVLEFLFDREGEKAVIDEVGLKAELAQGFEEVEEVGDLPRVNDSETVDIPVNLVTDFLNPPIHVLAETNDTPVEIMFGCCHS